MEEDADQRKNAAAKKKRRGRWVQGALQLSRAAQPPHPGPCTPRRREFEAPAGIADALGARAAGGRGARQGGGALHSALALMRGKQSAGPHKRPAQPAQLTPLALPRQQEQRPQPQRPPPPPPLLLEAGTDAGGGSTGAEVVDQAPLPSGTSQRSRRPLHARQPAEPSEAALPAGSASRSCGNTAGGRAPPRAAAAAERPWHAGVQHQQYFAAAAQHLRRVAAAANGLR